MSAGDWSFLRSRRWLGYFAMLAVFLVACHLLAQWQFARRAEARAELERIDRNYSAAAIPLESALPQLDAFDDAERWQPVEITGRYLAEEEVLVRNRPRNGQVGFAVITPMQTATGAVFFVDRGWVPGASKANTAVAYPAPPSGTVTIEARLQRGEPKTGRAENGRQFASIDLAAFAERVDASAYTGAYGQLLRVDSGELPLPALAPVRDEGPHLSYALQWYVFAIIAITGMAYAARQERRSLADDERDRYGGSSRTRSRAARRSSDSDVEDRILDESEANGR